MIESTEAWKRDIKKAERILRRIELLNNELRGINPEHVGTSYARQLLTTATGQLSATVMDEKVKFRREVYNK